MGNEGNDSTKRLANRTWLLEMSNRMKNVHVPDGLPLYILLHVDMLSLFVRVGPMGALRRTGEASKNSRRSSPFDRTLPDSKACYVVFSVTKNIIVSTSAGSHDVWWSRTKSLVECGYMRCCIETRRCGAMQELEVANALRRIDAWTPPDNENTSMHCKVLLPHQSRRNSGTLHFCISLEIVRLERVILSGPNL